MTTPEAEITLNKVMNGSHKHREMRGRLERSEAHRTRGRVQTGFRGSPRGTCDLSRHRPCTEREEDAHLLLHTLGISRRIVEGRTVLNEADRGVAAKLFTVPFTL